MGLSLHCADCGADIRAKGYGIVVIAVTNDMTAHQQFPQPLYLGSQGFDAVGHYLFWITQF
jgi:hypothetical protein